ncbi:hypothetical protein J6590_022429 [Homalodisca vitripennis]|nr:hypothetical protein J6590_022429 [Homalodisca vitripennis]
MEVVNTGHPGHEIIRCWTFAYGEWIKEEPCLPGTSSPLTAIYGGSESAGSLKGLQLSRLASTQTTSPSALH